MLIWFVATIAMFVWLVQGFLMKRKPARRKALYAFGAGFLALIGGVIATPPQSSTKTDSATSTAKSTATETAPASPAVPSPAPTPQDRLAQARDTLEDSCINDLVGSFPEFAPSAGAVTVAVPAAIKGQRVATQLQAGGQRFNCSWTVGAQDNLLVAADPAALQRAQKANEAAATAKAKADAEAQAAAERQQAAEQAAAAERASRPTGTLEVVSDGYFGCTEKDDFEKIVGYAAQQDEDAFRSALGVGLMSGLCTTFEKGELVLLQDTAMFSGMMKVRRKGELSEYWTNVEAAD